MSKVIGLTFLAALIGTSVMAWPRAASHEPRRASGQNEIAEFSPDRVQSTINASALSVQKIDDKTFVFSDNE